ncbi:TPA: hypothetical protein ACGQEN_001123 [Streptococcus pyogenes]|uniref:hypothetical protein n=1 Tax=Streptococcus pyogenes TaxID=1314 RepID=UPI0004D1C651|nr:hypothetical protein [Streptococcus pyogenes]AIG49978.1 hypothetical protein STAB901_02060 [Streptococcus pyogenes STAB901]HEP1722704.1 hypothetical protein [Streptococcus pyogenes]HEP2476583.1 hypothetical protein [Streptococcus pyogenes]HEP6116111.1 hypothetical protein [Streptococcus pyogenes]HER6144142.1 hypothetical protein [Streptococcus pyogenes]
MPCGWEMARLFLVGADRFFPSQLLAVAILPLQAVWASGRVLRLPILLVAF